MGAFMPEVLAGAANEREVTLTTAGRKSGKPRKVTIWIATDGDRMFIRSGQGMRRQWPQNLMAHNEGVIELAGKPVKFKPKHVATDEARAVSELYRTKYGSYVKPSEPTEPPTPGELATFEVLPAS